MRGFFSKSKHKDGFIQIDDSKYRSPSKIVLKKKQQLNSILVSPNDVAPATWSKFQPIGEVYPLNRVDSFCVRSQEHGGIFVGYGIYNDSVYMNDLWFYNIENNKWTQIPLTGEVISNRAGVGATIVNDYLICFGGYCNKEYYADLHTINVRTGEVRKIQTTGEAPTKRKCPVVSAYGNKLFVWGGYNGMLPNQLHILQMDTRVWTSKETNFHGRINPATFNSRNGGVIIYGGSKSQSVIGLDMKKEKMYAVPTIGKPPIPTTTGARFVRMGDYAYFIGGKTNTLVEGPMEIYALHLKNGIKWFKVETVPDCSTVQTHEGIVIKFSEQEKTFALKRFNSVAAFENEEKQTICFTLGGQGSTSSDVYSLDVRNVRYPAEGKENRNNENMVDFNK